MKKRGVPGGVGVLCLLLMLGTLSLAGVEKRWCPLCGMNLEMFRKTNVRYTFKDGTSQRYCSWHCAAIVYKKRKDDIVKVEVADFVTGKFIPADKAYYLVGSDLPGVMTVRSKKAFASLEEAKKFQKEHGGKIVRYPEVLEMAIEDLPKDMGLLRVKMSKKAQIGKKVAEAKGCFKCHGPGGKGIGKAPAWTSPGFAKRMSSKIKIKKVILEGKGKMPSFEGKISEKELQALMLYIWTIRPK